MRRKNTATGTGDRSVSLLDQGPGLTALEKCLLNEYQRGFPLCSEPYAEIAAQLDVAEADVIQTLESLQRRGFISRVGPVFAPQRAGASTLAALAVPEERLEQVADLVSAYVEVNHNYQREHDWNLWFVVTAPDQQRVQQVLADIESATGLAVLNLPLERAFYIDLGFPLWC
ncbi:MAG TPA: Lrp/AsnC family transcriptional regulator [Gammaproteobacteria bacterium]|nr:Lrp/AsnC family transcriptional regulator [Gammaproteobacteria bacterium]